MSQRGASQRPTPSGDFKDLFVGDEVRKIQRIGERRGTYRVQHDGKEHGITKMKEREPKEPTIIEILNGELKRGANDPRTTPPVRQSPAGWA